MKILTVTTACFAVMTAAGLGWWHFNTSKLAVGEPANKSSNDIATLLFYEKCPCTLNFWQMIGLMETHTCYQLRFKKYLGRNFGLPDFGTVVDGIFKESVECQCRSGVPNSSPWDKWFNTQV